MTDQFSSGPSGRIVRDVAHGVAIPVQVQREICNLTQAEKYALLSQPAGTPARDALLAFLTSRSTQRDTAKIKPSGVRLLSGSVFATAGTTAGTTWNACVALPVPFTHIAPVFLNVETGAITVSLCSAAAVANATPVANGGGYPWPAATYTSMKQGGATAWTLPARAAANQPSVTIGDMTALQSVPADDGSGMFYVNIRTFFSATGGGSGSGSGYSYVGLQASIDASPQFFSGQTVRVSTQLVDGVTTPASFTNGASTANTVLAGVAYRTEVGGIVIATIGDSTVRGLNGSSGVAGAVIRAGTALSTPARPVSVVNLGCSGAVPSDYEANGERYCTALKPHIAVYRTTSINEALTTQAIANSHMALFTKFADYCYQNGIYLVAETGSPQNLGSVPSDALRQAFNARVIAYCVANDIPYVDVGGILNDPAAPYQFLPAYNTDGSHPNDAGYDAIAAMHRLILAQYLY